MLKKTSLLAFTALSLASCQQSTSTSSGFAPFNFSSSNLQYKQQIKDGSKLAFDVAGLLPQDKINTTTRALVAEAMVKLDKGELEDASQLMNTALKMDLSNSQLHFINALTYHLMAKGGNAKNFEYAEQGYKMAYKFDSSNVQAKYYLGLTYLDQRKFKEAQAELAAAAVMDEHDPEILYDLARASYYAGDARTSKASLDKIAALDMNIEDEEKFLRANILANAALDRPAEANRLLAKFMDQPDTYKFLSRRVASWGRHHKDVKKGNIHNAVLPSGGNMQLAQALPVGADIPIIPGADLDMSGSNDASDNASFVNSDMVVVDVVIIRTQEDISSNRGLNLLSGLELQFGDPLTNASGWSFGTTNIDDNTSANSDTKTRTLSSLISVPAVNYSLNIFNTLDSRNEILASPSLVALANEKSEFFSGVDVVAAAVSGGDGSSISVNKKIGVKLGVTPEFLPDDQIKLQVEAERTFLTSPSSSVQFEFRLDTSNTNVNANVVMKFGETLILSGLSEKETENSRDAVPLLGDIPVIQYLFSKEAKRDYRKSVLIMLTPRRAQYVNRSPEERKRAEAMLSNFEKSLSTFESRNENWFAPRATMDSLIETTDANALFNEFKTGDFELESWNTRSTHEKRLKQALDFLFY
jgi:tetratricopeptide (TPR) repeat protein